MLRANDISIKGIDRRHRFITLVPNSADKSGNLKESRMQRKMRNRFCLGFAITVFLLIGCSESETDRQMRMSLVGTWKQDNGTIFTLHSDGKFTANVKTGSWGILIPTNVDVSGTWKLSRGYIVIHSDKVDVGRVDVVEKELILGVNRNTLRTYGESGKKYEYSRVN